MPASRGSASSSGASRRKRTPATTPEGRENKLITLATQLAERQLRDGTASSQVITHFLKLATSREELEKAKLEADVRLQEAKIKSMESSERAEALFAKAMNAFRGYQGVTSEDESEDYDEEYDYE